MTATAGPRSSVNSAGHLPFPGIAPSSQGTEPPPNSEDVRGERAVDVCSCRAQLDAGTTGAEIVRTTVVPRVFRALALAGRAMTVAVALRSRPRLGQRRSGMKRLRRSAVAAVGCLLAGGVLAVVPSVATNPAAALNVSESVLVVALGTSLPDVGTAASLVAAGRGDAVVLAEAVDELGPGAASIIADQQPDRIVVVGGAAAVGPGVESELRALAAGVDIDRLSGSDRIHTAALAAVRALSGSGSVTVVLANGWSLPDVGAAASAVASGAADAVLYSSRDALGEPTRQVLASHRPVRILVAGGPAAVSQDVLTSATGSAGVVLTERLGGSTRVETAALVAQRALDGGATTAVIANGWSLPDVGIAAGLAAALPDSVVLYTEPDSLGAATETALTKHTIKHVFLVGAVDADTTHLMSLVPSKFPLTRITTAAHASLHAVGTAAPASQSRFVAISASPSFTCGIGLDGMVECWGTDGFNVAAAPAESFSSLAIGSKHSCGLRLDGTVNCWLYDGRDGPVPPSGVFGALSDADSNPCGLRPDGTVECWGNPNTGVNDVPAGSFTEVSAGSRHACGLRTDGTIECWGKHAHGEPDGLTRVFVSPPEGAFVSVAARSSFGDVCGVRPNGTVECWGERYQRDGGTIEVPSGEFRSVASNSNHVCGIRTDSSVECWGVRWVRLLHAPHGAFSALSLGLERTCGLRLDGTVVCWGRSDRGQLKVPQRDDAPRLAPRLSSDAAGVVGFGTPFEVDVRFPLAVSGLEVDDFDVVNGDATALEGSGVSYRVTVVATSPGTAVIRVPERAAHDRLGYGNDGSQALAVTVTDGGPASTVGFDTWDREAVLAAYRAEFGREEPDWGYTGQRGGLRRGNHQPGIPRQRDPTRQLVSPDGRAGDDHREHRAFEDGPACCADDGGKRKALAFARQRLEVLLGCRRHRNSLEQPRSGIQRNFRYQRLYAGLRQVERLSGAPSLDIAAAVDDDRHWRCPARARCPVSEQRVVRVRTSSVDPRGPRATRLCRMAPCGLRALRGRVGTMVVRRGSARITVLPAAPPAVQRRLFRSDGRHERRRRCRGNRDHRDPSAPRRRCDRVGSRPRPTTRTSTPSRPAATTATTSPSVESALTESPKRPTSTPPASSTPTLRLSLNPPIGLW